MKLILVLIISNLTFIVNAQIRVQYTLNYKIDSTQVEMQTELFNLDIDHENSVFYPATLATMDSLAKAGKLLDNTKMVEPKLVYYVEKKGDDLTFEEIVAMQPFSIEESRKLQWDLVPNSMDSLHQYRVQKAKTTFAGRSWTAYYTSDIALSDGPYKFKGLPGLILQIQDQEGDYIFELSGLQQNSSLYKFDLWKKYGIKKIDISLDKYRELIFEIETNPNVYAYLVKGNYSNSLPEGLVLQLVDRYKKQKIKNNNPIELTLDE